MSLLFKNLNDLFGSFIQVVELVSARSLFSAFFFFFESDIGTESEQVMAASFLSSYSCRCVGCLSWQRAPRYASAVSIRGLLN